MIIIIEVIIFSLSCSFSLLSAFLSLNASISDLFFFFCASPSPSPSPWPGLCFFFQLPELNNTLQRISMQPSQKTEILLKPVTVPLPLVPPHGLSPPSYTLWLSRLFSSHSPFPVLSLLSTRPPSILSPHPLRVLNSLLQPSFFKRFHLFPYFYPSFSSPPTLFPSLSSTLHCPACWSAWERGAACFI